METMESAVISSNLKFGSTSSAKYIGLNLNKDLELFSQGNAITFKGNDINISTASGTTVLIDSGININKPCHSDCSVTFNNAKYMRGTTTQNTTHDILGLSSSDNVNIGSNSLNTRLRGKSIYLRDTTVSVTSDKNLKKDFNTFDERYDKFFDKLTPRTFKYIFGNSGRIHSGFVAQEVEDALNESNLTNQDIAIIDKINITGREVSEDDDGHMIDGRDSTINYLLDNGYNSEYAVRYDEFIALAIDQIQKLKARVLELENKIKE